MPSPGSWTDRRRLATSMGIATGLPVGAVGMEALGSYWLVALGSLLVALGASVRYLVAARREARYDQR